MIDFDEEIKKFKFAPEVDMAEQIIRENAMTDLRDVISNAVKANAEANAASDRAQNQ